MKKTEKLLLTFGIACALVFSIAATKTPPKKSGGWEYKVIKARVITTEPLNSLLNAATQSGWGVDSFSTHSTGNSENCVVILKREKQSEQTR